MSTDLPRRDHFVGQTFTDGYLPPGWRTVLKEFGSGRLVDRDTIDDETLQYIIDKRNAAALGDTDDD